MNLTPYRIVAKNALMSWDGLSEEEAQKVAETSTFDEIDSKTDAKSSMTYAIEEISRQIGSTEFLPMLQVAIFGDAADKDGGVFAKHEDLLKELGGFLKEKGVSVLDILSHVHDGWVKDKAYKFNQENRVPRKYQHLPIEMIGWKEAKADLLFVKPIMDAMGIEVDEKALEQEYNQRVVKYFDAKGLVNEKGIDKNALAKLIAKGPEFYPALTEENRAKSKEEATLMASQVDEKLANINLKSRDLK